MKIKAAPVFIIYFPDCQDGINVILNMQDYLYFKDIVSILFLITQMKSKSERNTAYVMFFIILSTNEAH